MVTLGRSRRLAAALLTLALATSVTGAVAGADAAGPVAGAAGIGDPYFPEDGNGGIDVHRYEIHDHYRFGTRRLHGWTKVTLTTTQTLSSFDLDFLLPVFSVRLSTGAATFSRPDRHELRITPSHPIARGTRLTARIAYAGHPGAKSWGGESNWLADGQEVVAMNQPHMAAWWFPSNDHPRDKARVDTFITVRRGHQVIANGHLAGVRRDAEHATFHWKGGGPMATYLAFFAAGDFAVDRGTDDGLPWYVAVSRQVPRAERRASMSLMRKSPRIVHWLAARLGSYPFHDTGGLVTSLQPGFALENQTRPTYEVMSGSYAHSTVVHELAHQWFGDSVSVHGWRDIWLNEGAATFMEHLWDERHGGESAATWFANTYQHTSPDSQLWHLVVDDPGPAHIFDWAVYDRGALALQALRQRIGDHDFMQVLRTWLRQRAYGTGTTAEFRTVAERVSGQDLGSFFTAWLDTAQKPAQTRANGF